MHEYEGFRHLPSEEKLDKGQKSPENEVQRKKNVFGR